MALERQWKITQLDPWIHVEDSNEVHGPNFVLVQPGCCVYLRSQSEKWKIFVSPCLFVNSVFQINVL